MSNTNAISTTKSALPFSSCGMLFCTMRPRFGSALFGHCVSAIWSFFYSRSRGRFDDDKANQISEVLFVGIDFKESLLVKMHI